MEVWKNHVRPISHYISETMQDGVIVTVQRQQELVCDVSNDPIFHDFEWPLFL